jgi:diadenylate cyclase
MITGFITIKILDIVDILLVAFLLYQFYKLIRGTVAINIFIVIFSVYLLWLLVKALDMELLSSILGQVIGVGVIALIIVFQQEIRRFLLIVGSRYMASYQFSIANFFSLQTATKQKIRTTEIVKACTDMSAFKTGALIAIALRDSLVNYEKTGVVINADTTNRLLQSIFFKNNPLHDGSVIIRKDKIVAASCVLPASERVDLPPRFGMRHRAAIGLTERTDAVVIAVSEETGAISFAKHGDIETNIGPNRLREILKENFEKE